MKYPWLDEYLMKKSGVTKNTENWNWVRYKTGDGSVSWVRHRTVPCLIR